MLSHGHMLVGEASLAEEPTGVRMPRRRAACGAGLPGFASAIPDAASAAERRIPP